MPSFLLFCLHLVFSSVVVSFILVQYSFCLFSFFSSLTTFPILHSFFFLSSTSHILFKDDSQARLFFQWERCWQRQRQLYSEIHRVSSCGLTVRTNVGRLKAGFWSGNHHVFMSTLIPRANGIHVRQISTQISPPTYSPNRWDYVWQWGQVKQCFSPTHTRTTNSTSTSFFSWGKSELNSFGIRMDWSHPADVLEDPPRNTQGWNRVRHKSISIYFTVERNQSVFCPSRMSGWNPNPIQ